MKARGAVLSRRNAHSAAISNWGTLHAGDQVEIIKHAHVIAAGDVEEVSQSGNVLWLAPADPAGLSGPAGPAERRLFLKSDGVQVRRANHH
ncbi:MAG TPA: hypothetical protein VIM08_09175 [Arthrobacter sp.]|jgi:hypothetical protein